MYFTAGAIQGILAISWWLYDLCAKAAGFFPKWPVDPMWIHAFLMMYGFFPFLIFGFLMTAAPNWVGGEKVKRKHYVPSFALMSSGISLFYAALALGRVAMIAAIALYLAGWLASWFALLNVALAGARDRGHSAIVLANVFIGWLGALSYLAWLLTGRPEWLSGALATGIWLFLLPIFLSVSHRMIPFFSGSVLPAYLPRRPYGPLYALLAGMALHAALELSGKQEWLWMVDLPMAAIALYFSWLWRFFASFANRLLAMLHIGFAWLGAALTLYAAQSLLLLLEGRALLGAAPLHALGIGYFSSMVLAMVTRVSLGHSGRPLVADRTTWLLFMGFQFAALFRVAGEIISGNPIGFYIAAALVWICAFAIWDARFLPIYWQPRVDGKPG